MTVNAATVGDRRPRSPSAHTAATVVGDRSQRVRLSQAVASLSTRGHSIARRPTPDAFLLDINGRVVLDLT